MTETKTPYLGYISNEELERLPGMPSSARLERGPVVCVECAQEIPCNPCEEACPRQAITVGGEITALPVLDGERCNGCGLCMARCPGLAIFHVHKNYSEQTALVGFPYEYAPLPSQGEVLPCAGRDGVFLTMGRVHRVQNPPGFDRTAIVTVEVPKAYCMAVRTICRKGAEQDGK